MRYLADAVPDRRKLRVAIVTEPAWFDPKTPGRDFDESGLSKLGYLLSPSTLGSTLDLMRDSRTLAFTGWQKEQAGRRCVVDRGSPTPAFRLDGTFTAPAPQPAAIARVRVRAADTRRRGAHARRAPQAGASRASRRSPARRSTSAS